MANNDIIARLLLNTDGFDSRLGKSRKQVGQFESAVSTMGKNALGAFKSLAGGVGVAFTAMETFNKIIDGSQGTYDAFHNAMGAAKDSVDNFFTAISTGDFSPFFQGLDKMWEKSIKAKEALDQLWNTDLSFGLMSSELTTEARGLSNTMRDPNASNDEKKQAAARLDQIEDELRQYARNARQRAEDAIRAEISSRTPLDASQIDLSSVHEAFIVDLMDAPAELRKEIQKEYKVFQDEYKKLQGDKYAASNTYFQTGNISALMESESIGKRMSALADKNRDVIIKWTLLGKDSDKLLQGIAEKMQKASAYEQQVNQVERMTNMAESKVTKLASGGTGRVASEATAPAEGSIAYIKTEISKLQNELNNAVTDEARIAAQKAITELQKELDAKVLHIKVEIEREKWEASPLQAVTPSSSMSSGATTSGNDILAGFTPNEKTEEMKEFSSSTSEAVEVVNSMSAALSLMSGIMDKGTLSWAQYMNSVLQAVAAAVPAIESLTMAKEEETAANATAAVTGGASSVASIPIAGPVLAVAAIASIVAALASIPKFATGGVVGGNSYYGDQILARVNSGELVLNSGQQAKVLASMSGGRELHITGEFVTTGENLRMTLDEYQKVSVQ